MSGSVAPKAKAKKQATVWVSGEYLGDDQQVANDDHASSDHPERVVVDEGAAPQRLCVPDEPEDVHHYRHEQEQGVDDVLNLNSGVFLYEIPHRVDYSGA